MTLIGGNASGDITVVEGLDQFFFRGATVIAFVVVEAGADNQIQPFGYAFESAKLDSV